MRKYKIVLVILILLVTGCNQDVGSDPSTFMVQTLIEDELILAVGDYMYVTLPGDSIESIWRVKDINLQNTRPYFIVEGEYGYSEEVTVYLDRLPVRKPMD